MNRGGGGLSLESSWKAVALSTLSLFPQWRPLSQGSREATVMSMSHKCANFLPNTSCSCSLFPYLKFIAINTRMKNVKWCQLSHHSGSDPWLNLCISLVCLNAKDLGTLERCDSFLFGGDVPPAPRMQKHKLVKGKTIKTCIQLVRTALIFEYLVTFQSFSHFSNLVSPSATSPFCCLFVAFDLDFEVLVFKPGPYMC